MPFSWDEMPYTNFHELNLDWFINKFKEIFKEWASLNETMLAWKNETDNDLSNWKTETLEDLDEWKDDFETLFNTTFDNLLDIKTDAEAARDRAETAAGVATEKAEYISDNAKQITLNKNNIMEIIKDLGIFYDLTHTWRDGGITSSSGGTNNNANRISSANYNHNRGLGTYIEVPEGYKAVAYMYESQTISGDSYKGAYGEGWYTDDFIIPNYWDYFKLVFAYTDDRNITKEEAPSITIANIYMTDTTLSLANKAADSKTVGYLISEITSDMGDEIKVASYVGGTTLANQTNNTICRISSLSSVIDAPHSLNGKNIFAWLLTFGRENKEQVLFVTANGYPCRFNRSYSSSTSTWSAWKGYSGDEAKARYIAFGASTTEARVHPISGTTVVSYYDYPDFTGRLLNLETYNLAVGSTGLVCRGTNNTPTKENYMDRIYYNNSLLETASLITIQFGYGNDRTPIYGDTSTVMPFGEWNDYYPYDEEGYHPFSDNLTDRITTDIETMVEKGATVLGCLNWCIKYLSTNYPKAQIILLFGAPSSNYEYPVSIVNNETEEGIGEPKYKLSVTARDADAGIRGKVRTLCNNLGLNLIDEYENNPFNYYNMTATDAEGNYIIFSTSEVTDPDTHETTKVFNPHPNDNGYLMYARFTAGKIAELFMR